jgi:hypothetical protein
MRPAGEIRRALRDAAWSLAVERASTPLAGGHWRELAQRSCVGFGAARETVKNMARAGELQAVGAVRVPGARRPMTVYAPQAERSAPAPQALDSLMRAWAR